MAAEIDWDQVRAILSELQDKTAPQAARSELSVVEQKIASEKKKLKNLASKHEQACDDLAKVRKTVQKERERLLETVSKLEQDMFNLQSKTDKDPGEINQLSVELAQAKKKIEAKKGEHDQHIDKHVQNMRKRERMVQVQAKSLRALLHQKVALGERGYFQALQTTTPNTSLDREESVENEKQRGGGSVKSKRQKGKGKSQPGMVDTVGKSSIKLAPYASSGVKGKKRGVKQRK